MGQDNRARRKFSDEFKRDAVELVRSTDRPIVHVADELGIYDSTLGNWVRKAEQEDDERDELSADERARLAELEAENAELRMECDLLRCEWRPGSGVRARRSSRPSGPLGGGAAGQVRR